MTDCERRGRRAESCADAGRTPPHQAAAAPAAEAVGRRPAASSDQAGFAGHLPRSMLAPPGAPPDRLNGRPFPRWQRSMASITIRLKRGGSAGALARPAGGVCITLALAISSAQFLSSSFDGSRRSAFHRLVASLWVVVCLKGFVAPCA